MDPPSTLPENYILLVAELGDYGLQPVAHLLLNAYPEPIPTPEDILSVFQHVSNRSGILNELKRAEELVANGCEWDEYTFDDDVYPKDRIDPPNRFLPFINSCLRRKFHGGEPISWPYDDGSHFDTLTEVIAGALVVDITDPSMMGIGKVGDDSEAVHRLGFIQADPYDGPLRSIGWWPCSMSIYLDPNPLDLRGEVNNKNNAEEHPGGEHLVEAQNEEADHDHRTDEDTLDSEEILLDYSHTLADQTFHKLVEYAVDSNDLPTNWLQKANELDWFESAVQDKFYDEPALMNKPGGPSLFAATLDTLPSVDLIVFRSITATQVIAVIRALQTSQQLELHLPDMESLEEEDFRELINTGLIRTLHLGLTPKLAFDTLHNIVLASSVEEFTCPELYRASCGDNLTYLSLRQSERIYRFFESFDRSSTNFPLQQVVFMISQSQDETEWNNAIQWCHAKMDKNRQSGFRWGIGVDAVSMPLADSFLPLAAIPDAIGRVLRVLVTMPVNGNVKGDDRDSDSWERLRASRQLAECFAFQRAGRLAPVPNFMYGQHRTNFIYSNGIEAPESHHLSQTGWTLFLHDFRARGSVIDYGDLKACSHLRYAFAKLDASGTPIALSAKEWFARMLGSTRADRAEALTAEWEVMLRDVQAYLSDELFVVVKKATYVMPPMLGSRPTNEVPINSEQETDSITVDADAVEWEDEEEKGYELGVCSATEALEGCRISQNRIRLLNLRIQDPRFYPNALGLVLQRKVGPWQMEEILRKFRPDDRSRMRMKRTYPLWLPAVSNGPCLTVLMTHGLYGLSDDD